MKIKIRLLVAGALLALALAGAVAFSAPEAEAWAWSPTVTMKGSATHMGGAPTWLYYRASNGECGWAWLGSGTLYGKPYSFTLNRVPFGSSTYVTISAGGAGWQHCDGFGVSRPASGTVGTRNLYWW